MTEFRLISAILRSTWLIHPEWVNQHAPLIARLLSGEDVKLKESRVESFFVNALTGEVEPDGGSKESRGTVAIIGIDGPLMKHDGLCSYGTRTYMQMIKEAAANRKVDAIVIPIDSPGGQVSGTASLAETIQSIDKPVVALVDDGMAASAAYWIGSAADEIYASRKTDDVGSIGVYMQFADYRGAYERMGIKVEDIYSRLSSEKNLDYRQALEGKYDLLKDELDYIARTFIDAVKSNRKGKLNLDAGDPFKGAIYNAEKAMEIGLIDGIMPFDAAVSRAYELSQDKNFKKSHNNMFGNKYPKLHALRGLAAEAVTDDQLEAVNAELQENGVTTVAVVSNASMDEAERAVTDLAAAQGKIKGLEGELAAAQADAAAWKAKAESYGAQPGAEPTSPAKEGSEVKGEESKDPFYSEADAEIDAILNQKPA